MILDERGFDGFMEWGQRAKDVLRPFGNPPSPTSDDQWREWGASLGLLAFFPIYPSPYTYGDWREWVRALNMCVDANRIRPAWNLIPNMAKTGAFSVNILTTYFYPIAPNVTLALVGVLPTGWAFDGIATLSHSGAVLSGPNSISFVATYNGVAYPSNTFTVQGI